MPPEDVDKVMGEMEDFKRAAANTPAQQQHQHDYMAMGTAPGYCPWVLRNNSALAMHCRKAVWLAGLGLSS